MPLQDRKAAKRIDLCNSLVHGKCHWGEKCRYSHDVEAYLQGKPADLPGRCPFSSLDECPFSKKSQCMKNVEMGLRIYLPE